MIKESRCLPPNTYVVFTEGETIFVHATSYLDAEAKAKSLGYKNASSYETIEVIRFESR